MIYISSKMRKQLTLIGLDEFHFRWFKNYIIESSNSYLDSIIFNHLKWNDPYSHFTMDKNFSIWFGSIQNEFISVFPMLQQITFWNIKQQNIFITKLAFQTISWKWRLVINLHTLKWPTRPGGSRYCGTPYTCNPTNILYLDLFSDTHTLRISMCRRR